VIVNGKGEWHWTSGFYVWRGMMRGVDHGYVRGLRVGFVH
jgi:hypothetical protein